MESGATINIKSLLGHYRERYCSNKGKRAKTKYIFFVGALVSGKNPLVAIQLVENLSKKRT
jgi:hypothetical protein